MDVPIFLCSEGNCLRAIIDPSFVAFLMNPNMMFWHKKLMPRHCPSSGPFIQKTANTSAGGYLQCVRAIWRFFFGVFNHALDKIYNLNGLLYM